MSTEPDLSQLKIPNNEEELPSENSLEYDNSKWSSVDSLVKGSESIVNLDENDCGDEYKSHRCTSFLSKLLHSVLVCDRHKESAPPISDSCDGISDPQNRSAGKELLSQALEGISLVQGFIGDALLPKLESHLDQVHYPGMSNANLKSLGGLSIRNQSLSLPTAQAWIAIYLIKLMYDDAQSAVGNSSNEKVDNNGNATINFQPFRRPFISLCWEMEVARRIGNQFYTEFEEFTESINNTLKELRVTLMASDMFNNLGLNQQQLVLQDDSLELNIKQRQREKTPPIVLYVDPSLNLKSPLTLSIVSKHGEHGFLNNNNHDVAIPKNFSKLSSFSKEKIVTDLLKTVTKFVENTGNLLGSSVKRISSKGIIKKCNSSGKPLVTCHGALKKVKGILGKLLSSKTAQLGVEGSETPKLAVSISHLFRKWNEYVTCGQGLILKFYELCDMISICYSFAAHHIDMNIPEWGRLQKEVEMATAAHTRKMFCSCRCQCGIIKLKGYVISNLMEECDKKILEAEELQTSKELKRKLGEYFCKQLLSTWYHIVLQQSPIEMEDLFGKYELVVKASPDLERVESDMIFNSGVISAAVRNPDNKLNVILEPEINLNTFK